MRFTKMHGLGNDFILINCIEEHVEDPSGLAKDLCDRHFGVGADGILLVLPSDCADFRMRLFNHDGSEGEMCGNGIRCFAKYVYDKGLSKKEKLNIETLAGIKTVELTIQDEKAVSMRVNLGSPKLRKEEVPVTLGNPDDMMLDEKVNIPSWGEQKLTAVNTGVPHAVLFVDEVETTDVIGLGSSIRKFRKIFPEGTNVNFVQFLERNHFKVRTYERGVENETLACGTGAVAVSVAVALLNKIDSTKILKLDFKGGEIKTEVNTQNKKIKNVYMSGPAKIVFEGVYPNE
jgi:diaminopimelate epimerase